MLKETAKKLNEKLAASLNPYFNGTCSKRLLTQNLHLWTLLVLILILMEHAQRERGCCYQMMRFQLCLNPYFNGTCSKRGIRVSVRTLAYVVLILILMEHAQRGYSISGSRHGRRRLNPYFNGTCSKSWYS